MSRFQHPQLFRLIREDLSLVEREPPRGSVGDRSKVFKGARVRVGRGPRFPHLSAMSSIQVEPYISLANDMYVSSALT